MNGNPQLLGAGQERLDHCTPARLFSDIVMLPFAPGAKADQDFILLDRSAKARIVPLREKSKQNRLPVNLSPDSFRDGWRAVRPGTDGLR